MTPDANPKLPPVDVVLLMPTIDGVAFRAAPDINSALLRRFSPAEVLRSLEGRAATLSKVGVEGQWLNIQAQAGDEGFVAAWYVRMVDAIAPSMGMPDGTDLASAVAPAAALTVRVIEDQLAFRSQPLIGDSTLIARLPIGSILTVIDPATGQKIGVEGQWLEVKDASGREGYVAAWFVSR